MMTKLKTIALLTDFGGQDVYVGVMKGVIVSINTQIPIIDLTHEIPPQNLIAGRFALLSAYAYFSADTVYIAVVDPGVGSRRRGVAIKFARGFLVGPDNGLFSGILSEQKAIAAVELTNNLYWRTPNPSRTFHGRDIFASVGAHIANGVNLQELGREIPVDSLVSLSLPQVAIANEQITGCIQYIDRFGNLVTNISEKNAEKKLLTDSQVTIKERIIPWGQTYSDGRSQELIALIGSHGYLEIAVNCGNAQQKLQVQLGEKVILG
jgi:S-adenosyl-L-methionine hydrolase (adenosine-forming)